MFTVGTSLGLWPLVYELNVTKGKTEYRWAEPNLERRIYVMGGGRGEELGFPERQPTGVRSQELEVRRELVMAGCTLFVGLIEFKDLKQKWEALNFPF
nr:MAG: hypothetical protein EDM05_05900 [Leptolyngbya sp. IPPAS B-1204]